ncbi:MAG: hypothetical protein U1E65_31755 [Myxococcota bacterium]
MRSLFALGAAVLGISCTERQIERLDLSGEDLEVAVAVMVASGERPTRVSAPFSIHGGALGFGELPSFEATPEEVGIRVVSLSVEEVRASSRYLAEVHAADLHIELGTPPSAATLGLPGSTLVVIAPLPTSASVRMPSSAGPTDAPRLVLEGLHLRATPPHDALPAGAGLVPFADRAKLFADRPVLPGHEHRGASYTVQRLLALDADTLIAATESAIFLVERGKAVSLAYTPGQPSPFVPLSAIDADPGSRMHDLAMVGDELIAVGDRYGASPYPGLVWRFRRVGRGLIAVGTGTITDPAPHALKSIALDAAGGLVAGGDLGTVLSADPARDPGLFVPSAALRTTASDLLFRATTMGVADLISVLSTGDAGRSILLGGSNGRVIVGNPRLDQWSLAFDGGALDPAYLNAHIFGLARGPGELWAVAGDGVLFRKLGEGPGERVLLRPPPDFERCTVFAASSISIDTLFDVVTDETHAYLIVHNCSALIRLRKSDDAVSVIAQPGIAIDRSDDELRRFLRTPSAIFVGGDLGAIYELRLP